MKKAYQILFKGFVISVFTILPLVFFGQEAEETEAPKQSSFSPYWYIKGSFGAAFDHSDLNKNAMAPDFGNIQIAGQGSIGRQFCPVFGLHAAFNRGFLKAGKEGKGLSYESDYFEFAMHAPFNISNLLGGYKDRTVNIWTSVGFGQVQYKSNVYVYDTENQIATLGYDNDDPTNTKGDGLGGRRIVAILPVGFGVSYAATEKLDLNFDYIFKFADSDIIDGLTAGAAAVKQDMYSFAGLGATYKFGQSASLKKMAKDFNLVTLETTPEVLKEKGNTAEVTIKGTFPPKYFNKKAAMLFQPVLKYEGGEFALKPITLKGEDVVGDGIVINSKTGGSFTYTDVIPYNDDMKVSELVVNPVAYIVKEKIHENRDEIVIKEKFADVGERKLADGIIYTSERICPGVAELIAAHHGYEKEVIVTEKSKVFYKVNRYNLNWRLPLNKKECTLDKLKNMWSFVEKGWVIKDITIDGWASPEGEETFNENLSENRTKSAYKYMLGKFQRISKKKDATVDYMKPCEQITFNMKHHGPDWAGFMNSVEKSEIEDKNVILNVIRSAGSQEKKEQEIRNMILIYPEIEDDILKPLRRAVMSVNCYEPKRTDEEIAELSLSNPGSLKVEELLFAATLTDDKGDRLEIFESIIEIYPDDWKAYNNAGACKYKAWELEPAAKYFEKAVKLNPNSGKAYNNLGVVALADGAFDEAEEMFNKAESLGVDANYNLGLVEIEKGNYDKALKLLGGKNCDYNAGLAQLVAENYSKAENTLKCVKDKTAGANYLLAVIGARTDNSEMMYEYLTKAIKEKGKLKEVAKTDREFLKYFNEPDFQALVQ